VPLGARSVAAVNVTTGAVVAYARWYPDDSTPPVVTGSADRVPDGSGSWFNHPVVITWTATDNAGTTTTPAPTTASTDGADVIYTSAESCDTNGNCSTGSFSVSLDTVAPVITGLALSANPVKVGAPTTLQVTANDALSGVASAEYWIDSDPGAGMGTSLTASTPGTFSATLSGLSTGVHTIGVRARDAAGTWSAVSTALPVVYNPNGGFAVGGGWLVPGGSTSDSGDLLPGINGTSKAHFGFVVKYQKGASTVPSGSFQFRYKVGDFELSSAGYDWLVVTNSQWAHFSGTARLNGGTEAYPMTVSVRDSNKSGTPDRLVLKVFAVGADPSTSSPIYQASGDVKGGSISLIRIRHGLGRTLPDEVDHSDR
jgi:hypothetical protein